MKKIPAFYSLMVLFVWLGNAAIPPSGTDPLPPPPPPLFGTQTVNQVNEGNNHTANQYTPGPLPENIYGDLRLAAPPKLPRPGRSAPTPDTYQQLVLAPSELSVYGRVEMPEPVNNDTRQYDAINRPIDESRTYAPIDQVAAAAASQSGSDYAPIDQVAATAAQNLVPGNPLRPIYRGEESNRENLRQLLHPLEIFQYQWDQAKTHRRNGDATETQKWEDLRDDTQNKIHQATGLRFERPPNRIEIEHMREVDRGSKKNKARNKSSVDSYFNDAVIEAPRREASRERREESDSVNF